MKGRRASVGTIFLIVFIDLVGFGMIIPILPLYAERYEPSPVVFGIFLAAYSAMQFLAAPILGRLSDRYGRRPVLLVSLLGSAAGYVLLAVAGSIELLILSRVIDGISGGNISTAQAVIADITGPEERARGMGIIGAAFGLGFITGPAIGGLLGGIAPWMPGAAAAVASLVAFALVATVLPETRPESAAASRRGHPLAPRHLGTVLRRPLLAVTLAAAFLVVTAFAHFEATFAQLAALRLSYGIREVSFLFVYAGLLAAFVQGWLVGRLVPRFGEARLLVGGTVVATAATLVIPGVTTLGGMLAILAALAAGHGLLGPCLSSLITRLVEEADIGGILGVQQALASLARVVGPFAAQLAWGSLGPQWPYVFAAGAYAATFLAAALILARLVHGARRPRAPA